MKCRLYILFLFAFFSVNFFAQNVSDVTFYQEGKNIVVTYSLDNIADISLCVSTDGGVTYSKPLKHVSGDVGKDITAGAKQIIWDVLAEYDSFTGDNIMFLVTAEGYKRSFTVNGLTFNMIQVEGGTFTMGATNGKYTMKDEIPRHEVTLNEYYIGETEVTQALWKAVMKGRSNSGSNKPITSVSWDDCQEFMTKLNALTGKTFRLPTEAEWEFAARGGNKSKGYKYSGSNNPKDVAWFGYVAIHPVAQKTPNELGLYDMSGNVFEWCGDWYDQYSSAAQINPTGPTSGTGRVLRGGAHHVEASHCTVSYRSAWVSDYRNPHFGFRLVLVP